MATTIQVTYDGEPVACELLHDFNMQVDTETALDNIIVERSGELSPYITIDGCPVGYNVSTPANKAGTYRREQFGVGARTTDDYHSGQTGADADALVFEEPYGFYSPTTTVFLLCYDNNLDENATDIITGDNSVIYPINSDTFIVTPPIVSGGAVSIGTFTYWRTPALSIESTSGGKLNASYGVATPTTYDQGTDPGSTTLKFTIANIGEKINRIIMLRLSKFEVYRPVARVTAPFICPKIRDNNMTEMYNSIHLLNLPSWFGIDMNNNLYIGQANSGTGEHNLASLYCVSDDVVYDVNSYFTSYFTGLYSGTSNVRINCAGLHNNLLLLHYTCGGYANDPYYGTSRGNKYYYETNFPDNVPLYSLDKTNNLFKRWGYADFSLITDTYSRIYISAIGDRTDGTNNNILTFALFGYNSSTPTDNYFYIVNGTTALQVDGTYIFTATSYEKIQLDIGGYTSVPDYLGNIYQANGTTFFKQSSSFLTSSNSRKTQYKDFGTYILSTIPTDNTIEITDNIKTMNFDCITESGSASASGAVRIHKSLMPISGIGGINKRAFVIDNTNGTCTYKIVTPTYNETPVLLDIALKEGGVDIGANKSIELTLTIDANDELDYGED